MNGAPPRKVYCILSARSLPYAEKCVQSLFATALEPVDLTLITDGPDDKRQIVESVERLGVKAPHRCVVYSQPEADAIAASKFAGYENLQQFRFGHPCWRKLTDPLLFAAPGEEMIILDPDLYFPNRFTFEPTLASGVVLMWQPPNCLLPDETVLSAYRSGVRLAHHVDIGVAQLRNDVDLAWFDWLVGVLGGKAIPRKMHVEAIVWAAMAMRIGGGYFDPEHWNCYQYRQWKRVAMKLGVSGVKMLAHENIAKSKCFHASGVSKWFVKEACELNLFPPPATITEHRAPMPYEELTPAGYEADQRPKRLARRLGYYKIFKPS